MRNRAALHRQSQTTTQPSERTPRPRPEQQGSEQQGRGWGCGPVSSMGGERRSAQVKAWVYVIAIAELPRS